MILDNFEYNLNNGEDEYSPPIVAVIVESFTFPEVALSHELFFESLKTTRGESVFINVDLVSGIMPDSKALNEAARVFNANLSANWLKLLEEAADQVIYVAKADAKNAKARYQTAVAMKEALTNLK